MAKTHGMSKTPMYRLWWGMICRCKHQITNSYSNYGGRGISVCDRWLKFENFYQDMGDRPEGMSIDRVDVNADYSPDNCRWVDSKTQQRNRNNNVRVSWNGDEYVLSDLCKKLGIHSTHLYRNINRGMDLLGAINHLVRLKEKRNAEIIAA